MKTRGVTTLVIAPRIVYTYDSPEVTPIGAYMCDFMIGAQNI